MRLKFLLGVCFFFGLTGCRQERSEFGVHLNFVQRELANGLKVIMVEDPTVPVVSYQTWFRVGSVDDLPGMTGISHMFEHLMFKGTAKYGPQQFFEQLETKGAEINAFTTRDNTIFSETFPKELLEKVVDMESDRLGNLIFTEDHLNAERMLVFEERRLRMDGPVEGRMQEAIWQLAYRQHPYQWPVIGYPSDIMKITTPILIDYFKTYFQPANATLVILGDFKTEDLFKSIKKAYGVLEGKPLPTQTRLDEPPQTEERRLTIREPASAEKFVQAYHITAADHEDSYSLDVLATILFEGTQSRAFRRLVEQKRLLVNISGSAYTPKYPGLLLISGTANGQVSSTLAETELDRLFDQIKSEGVTEAEVSTAVKQLTVQFLDGLRTLSGLGQMIGTVQTIFDDPQRFYEDLTQYSKVTPQSVQKVAKRYIDPNNRSVVTLVPQEINGVSR